MSKRMQIRHGGAARFAACLLATLSAGELAVAGDPDLEPGFPVQAYHGAGSYHSGPAIHTLVADIDDDPELEIIVTGLATGPLYAWNHDGTPVSGWPVSGYSGAGYVAAGALATAPAGLQVFSGYWSGTLAALAGDGTTLPGWPRSAANYISTPPALADVDGNGLDEIFIGEEDWDLYLKGEKWGANYKNCPAWHGPTAMCLYATAPRSLNGYVQAEALSIIQRVRSGLTCSTLNRPGPPPLGPPSSCLLRCLKHPRRLAAPSPQLPLPPRWQGPSPEQIGRPEAPL